MNTVREAKPDRSRFRAKPGASRAYLQDPNYYRLLYQLLVQYANGARQHIRGWDKPSPSSFSAHEFERGRLRAGELLQDTRKTLLRLEQKEKPQRVLPLRERLSLREQRLQRFLAGTVHPCTRLLIASWFAVDGMTDEAQRHIVALRREQPWRHSKLQRRGLRRTLAPEPIQWSYRAFYNLACYAATAREFSGDSLYAYEDLGSLVRTIAEHDRTAEIPPERDEMTLILWALRQAFSRTPCKRLAGMISWASNDPALLTVCNLDEVQQLLERYSPPKEQPAPKKRSVNQTQIDDSIVNVTG